MKRKFIVISLGGSLIAPRPGEIDHLFLKKFRDLIIKELKKGRGFVLVTGGGQTCRLYQGAAVKIKRLTSVELDWLGIQTTWCNAELLKTIFGTLAHKQINTNPTKTEKLSRPILVAGGWKPGWSTDYDAVKLAVDYGAKEVINLSNIDYVYTADPKKDQNAKKIEKISWTGFLKLVGDKRKPGGNWPFDPVASRLAAKNKIKVLIMNGRNPENLKNYLGGKKYIGTSIN